ncbi:DUF1778 domain-containing protein [Aliagarivorans taiwanensis]|uniref:type II toxin-antitoxin system TacA family antitoxin n=1 Tax=Aliagarivorans taiwanensis TaxID=561966 RepID=UPI00041EE887|nr:DUF1778 domain-containing protein [Aliagarivorans taiwanensis]
MATKRFEMRLDDKLRRKAEKASALLGRNSLTEYVVRLLEADVERVISEHESFSVREDIFTQFMAACEQPAKPNAKLQSAFARYKEQGFK